MATATESVKECRVCATSYVDPRLLPCHHPLCKACVDRLAKSGKLECPTCRRECEINDVVADFRLDEFLQAFKEQEEYFHKIINEPLVTGSDMCELCGESAIAFRCEDCAQWICSTCKKIHLKTTSSKTHQVKNIPSLNEEIEVILNEEINNLKKKINDFQQVIERFQGEITKTQSVQLRSLEASRKLREECLHQVGSQFDRIDDQILQDSSAFLTTLEKGKETNEMLLQDLETKCAELEQIIKEESQELAVKGVAILKKVKQQTEDIAVPEVQVDSLDMDVIPGQSWDATQAVTLKVGNVEIQFQEGNLASTVLWGMEERTCVKTVPLRTRPLALRFIQGDVWQCHDEGINIYDDTMALKKTISLTTSGIVYDVCDLLTGDFAAATGSGLIVMDQDGNLKYPLGNGRFTGVVKHEDRLYAVDITSRKIYVFQHCDGFWLGINQFKVESRRGFIITLGVHSGLLYACLSGNNKIVVYSLKGQVQRISGCLGAAVGQLNDPFVCTADQNGSLLVADRLNNRFQVLNESGQWQVAPLTPQLAEPRSALFTEQNSYTASWNPHKLSVYTFYSNVNSDGLNYF